MRNPLADAGGFFVFDFLPKSLLKGKENDKNMVENDENTPKYDVILQNNASKEFFLLTELEDKSNNHLYAEFDQVDIDAPEGEYTYVMLGHVEGADFELKTPVLSTILHYETKDVVLKDLHPAIGLLRIGHITPENTYDTAYSGGTAPADDTIFYYEG